LLHYINLERKRRKIGCIGFRGQGWDEFGLEEKSRMNRVHRKRWDSFGLEKKSEIDWVWRRRVGWIWFRGEK